MHVEYKVIPAPTKGRKGPGMKTAEARFAHAIQELMNALAADGWQYLRADLLPSAERQGLTSSHIVYRSVLVFQRAIPKPQTEEIGSTAPGVTPARGADPAIMPAPPPRPDVLARSLAPETDFTDAKEGGAEKGEDKPS